MKRISVALGALAIALLAAFVVLAPVASSPSASFGAANSVQTIGGFPYFLAGSGISSSGTSITLTSLTLPQTGYKILTTDLGQPFYVTIEPGSTSRQEFASCTTVTQNTNNTATLSGCVRGLMPIAPYTTNSQYAFSHSGGTTLIFSNSPQFYQQFLALGNVATSTNTLIFGSTTPPQYDADPVWGNFSTKILADVSYVNSVVAGGAANASETVKGIVQLATGAQAASSTSLGSTAARLAIGANLATDTPNTNTNKSDVLMSDLTGHLRQSWLDLSSSAQWTFNGPISVAASSAFKLTLDGVSYAFPATQGASSTAMLNDGSGNLTNSRVQTGQTLCSDGATYSTQNTGVTVLRTCVIPAGAMSSNDIIKIVVLLKEAGGASTMTGTIAIGNGSASTTIANTAVSNTGLITAYIMNLNSVSSQESEAITSNGTTNTEQESSPAVNMANQWYISFSGNVANASDTFNYKGISTVVQR